MTEKTEPEGVYGIPSADLVPLADPAIQFSPLMPGAQALERQGEATLARLVMLAPPGTVERRYAMALALRALKPGAKLTVLAPNDRGGARLAKELAPWGPVAQASRRHHRICTVERPAMLTGLEPALTDGAARFIPALGLWSQPGVFSWDRIDPGSALLIERLPPLAGQGADLGCGIGILARAVLASAAVHHLAMIDIDRRAIEAARRNVDDSRVELRWADAAGRAAPDLTGLDFVVMNPPFHDGGAEDRALGQDFIRRAAEMLKPGGVCWLTANRHLPYESAMKPLFKSIALKVETGAYKVYEATA